MTIHPTIPTQRASMSLAPDDPGIEIFKLCDTFWTTDAKFEIDTNGSKPIVPWCTKDAVHNHHSEGCDGAKACSQLDHFLTLFPPKSLCHIVTLTNAQLAAKGHDEMDIGEFLHWFGVALLLSWCEFANCRELWSSSILSCFLPPIELGRTTGVTCIWLDETWNCSQGCINHPKDPTVCHQKNTNGC